MADVLSSILDFYNKKKPYSLLKDDQPVDDKALKLAAAPDPDEEPSPDIAAKKPAALSALVRPQQKAPAEDLAAPVKPPVSEDDNDNQSGKYVRSSMVMPEPKTETQEPQATNFANSPDAKPKSNSIFDNDKAVEAMMAVLPALAGAALGGLGGAAAGSKAGAETLDTMMKDKKEQKKLDQEYQIKMLEAPRKAAQTEKLDEQVADLRDAKDPNSVASKNARPIAIAAAKAAGQDASWITDQTSLYDIKNSPLKAMVTGGFSNQRADKFVGAKDRATNTNASLGKERLGLQEGKAQVVVSNKFDKDPVIVRLRNKDSQIGIDNHTLDTAKMITPQILSELEQGVASAISGGGSAAVSKVHAIEMQALERDWINLKQRVTSVPADVGMKEYREQLKEVLSRIHSGIAAQMETQKKLLGQGLNFSNKSMQDVLEAKMAPPDAEDENLHPQDNAAVTWAKANPKDPRSAAILKANGL